MISDPTPTASELSNNSEKKGYNGENVDDTTLNETRDSVLLDDKTLENSSETTLSQSDFLNSFGPLFVQFAAWKKLQDLNIKLNEMKSQISLEECVKIIELLAQTDETVIATKPILTFVPSAYNTVPKHLHSSLNLYSNAALATVNLHYEKKKAITTQRQASFDIDANDYTQTRRTMFDLKRKADSKPIVEKKRFKIDNEPDFPYFYSQETKKVEYVLRKPHILVGRSGSNNYTIDFDLWNISHNNSISHKHYSVKYVHTDQTYRLKVFGRNGLLHNDKVVSVGKKALLSSGDVITAGRTSVIFGIPQCFTASAHKEWTERMKKPTQ